MAKNKSKVDRLHENIPRIYKTKTNPNWKALIEAFGDNDEELSVMLLERILVAIHKMTTEIHLISWAGMTEREVNELHRKRLGELAGDYATEDQLDVMIEYLTNILRERSIF